MTSALSHLPLTPLDHLPPHNYTASVFYLSLQPDVSSNEAFQVLQKGLHKTFAQLPWLSGKIWEQSAETHGWRPGQLEIRYEPVGIDGPPPYQLRLNHLSTSLSYDDLKEAAFPTDAFEDSELTWAPFMPDLSHGCEVFVAQANFLPGGFIVTGGLHHVAGDGNASFMIFNQWADHCKALQNHTTPPATPPPDSSDRNLHDWIWAKEGTGESAPEIDAEVWRLLGLGPSDADLLLDPSNHKSLPISDDHKSQQDLATAGVNHGHQRSLKSAIFYMSPSNFTALQTECAHELGAAAQISGTHAICGLVWYCLMKAQSAEIAAHERTQEVDILLDGRSGFSHSLPQMYLGNHTLHLQSFISHSANAPPDTSIASVAGIICKNLSRVDSTKLLNMYTLLREMPDYNALQRRKWQPQMKSFSSSKMMITSMLMVPSDRVRFGDRVFRNEGKPDGARVLMGAFNRSGTRLCFVLPKTPNGGVEFIINLYQEEMDALLDDEEFNRYAAFLA